LKVRSQIDGASIALPIVGPKEDTMKKSAIFLSKLAGIAAVTLIAGTSAFADSRHLDATANADDQGRGSYDRRADRHDVTMEGRVTNITRERSGYRVTLDRGGYSFWLRDLNSARGNRGRGSLRVGINIRIGGTFEPRYGYVVADSYDWLDDVNGGYGNRAGTLRAVVERIDVRRGSMIVRDESGRLVTADMTHNDRRWNRDRGVDLDDLHRGDRVTLAGSWARGDVFVVNHVEDFRSGRRR
jgi:hypothetical protein